MADRANFCVLVATDGSRAGGARGRIKPRNRFHAPQEAARILGEAIDFARRGQAAALAAGR
jgi:hypothetical protein